MRETNTHASPLVQGTPAASIEAALEKVLQSQRFQKAEALRIFLGFIVGRALTGHADELKESVIAIEAFQRRTSFDPRLDAFVRVQAGRLRAALAEYYAGEGLHDPVRIDVPKGSYAPVFSQGEQVAAGAQPQQETRRRPGWRVVFPAVFALLLLAATAGWLVLHRGRQLPSVAATGPEKATIVVADFENTTGDPVFDGTIRQALLMDLEQSPSLNVLAETEVREVEKLMARSPAEPLTLEVARDVCQRAGGKAVLSGSIAGMGQLYVIGINATACATGDVLAREQARASGKEEVLRSLDTALMDLRMKLGESLANLQRYRTPMEQVTTPSLKALQSYSEGMAVRNKDGDAASVPYFLRAIELDPTFAMAYNRLGGLYFDSMKFDLASAMFRKAYALRGQVSQRERFYIESRYYHFAEADLDKALAVYEDWQREFPYDSVPFTGAGMIHNSFGMYEKSVVDFQQALGDNPNLPYNYTNLAESQVAFNQPEKARLTLAAMQQRGLQEMDRYLVQYQLALLEGDRPTMEKLPDLVEGDSEVKEILLLFQAQTSASEGKLRQAESLVRQAVSLALGRKEGERAAAWEVEGALIEAEMGSSSRAAERGDAALRISRSKETRTLAALALALAGNGPRATTMANQLRQEFRQDTMLGLYWLPAIEAATEMTQGNWRRAVEILEVSRRCETGQPSGFQVLAIAPMFPAYLRGQALLKLGKGREAEAEFDKILQHTGALQDYPLSALARAEKARSIALQGDFARASAVYGLFLRRWQNADPDSPILRQAKEEAADLQGGRASLR